MQKQLSRRMPLCRRVFVCHILSILGIIFSMLISTENAFAAEPSNLEYIQMRNRMVKDDLEGQGIKNPRVLRAFLETPRHEFIPVKERRNSYFDMAIQIGESQTISAPFVVAYMTEQLDPQPTDKILEIGTGSGFQAAILSPLAKEIYSIEIVEHLGKTARKTLDRLKITNVMTKIGDGYQGWTEHAPFDKIIVTCSPESVPQALVDQLKEGGRMIIPVGERYQQVIYSMEKKNGKLEKVILRPTLFVPMTGKAEELRAVKPDPMNPKVQNPSFEEIAGDSNEPVAWYYQRQMKIVTDEKAPDGRNFLRFTNSVPGRPAQIMQGIALDGRAVQEIELSIMVRAKDAVGPQQRGTNKMLYTEPVVLIVYFDENRARLKNENWLGPFRGTFDWKKASKTIQIPPATREINIVLGMLGATGQIDFDLAELKVTKSVKKK